jgi:SAM-dependent methyltransferase
VGWRYDRALIAGIFDDYGEREWQRHDASPAHRVSFYLHRHYLAEFVSGGDQVLDIGAGPGRFTIELARLGAHIFVGDISQKQLQLNEQNLKEAGYEASVTGRAIVDVTDLSRFADATFDAVVCYGSPLGWVLDGADAALGELLRVLKPGGPLLASVSSLYGSFRSFLPGVAKEIQRFGLDEMREIFDTGSQGGGHSPLGPHHMFTWRELSDLIARHPCQLKAASASNFLALQNDEITESWSHDTEMWEQLLDWELTVCRQAGALDGGTHIIFVVLR